MSMPSDTLMPEPPQPEKSNKTCLILGLIFGGLGGFVLVCGGCCVFGMFQFSGILEEAARSELADNAVIIEHIGEIQSLEVDWSATIDAASQRPNTFVFDVQGDKDSGVVSAQMDDRGGQLKLLSGQVRLSNGDSYELVDGADLDGLLAGESDEEANAEFARQVRNAVSGNPVLVERIGEIQSFTYDLPASLGEPGDEVYVFHVTGANGSGKLRAECITVDEDTESVTSAELVLEDGEQVQLFPDKPLE